jgi:hypothetical protein
MPRSRISTTVDEKLLSQARAAHPGRNDASLFDEALTALMSRARAAEIDDSYRAYLAHPIDEPDEWGDLATFRAAAAAT